MANVGTAGNLEFHEERALNRLEMPGRLRGMGYARTMFGAGAGGVMVTLPIDETGRAGRLVATGLIPGPFGYRGKRR